MQADILIKALSGPKHNDFRGQLGLPDPSIVNLMNKDQAN